MIWQMVSTLAAQYALTLTKCHVVQCYGVWRHFLSVQSIKLFPHLPCCYFSPPDLLPTGQTKVQNPPPPKPWVIAATRLLAHGSTPPRGVGPIRDVDNDRYYNCEQKQTTNGPLLQLQEKLQTATYY